jgi:hypothetical protein
VDATKEKSSCKVEEYWEVMIFKQQSGKDRVDIM